MDQFLKMFIGLLNNTRTVCVEKGGCMNLWTSETRLRIVMQTKEQISLY